MPEHESAPAAPVGGVAGGYPPMAPLRGAVPGWPEDRPLTPVCTPEAARAALRSEAETSVLHPAGLRWGLVRRVGEGVQLAAWLWLLAELVRTVLADDDTEPATAPLVALLAASLVTHVVQWAWQRVDPARDSLPPTRRERAALTRSALRGDLETPPAAAWPAGAEAFSVLSTVAMTDGIDTSWLLDRTRMPGEVGEQWLGALARLRWISGGEAVAGGRMRRP